MIIKKTRSVFLFTLVLMTSFESYSDPISKIKVSSNVPDSFQGIKYMEDSAYDIYLNESYVGTIVSEYSNSEINFLSTSQVMSLVKGNSRDQDFLKEILDKGVPAAERLFVKENESIIVSINKETKEISVLQKDFFKEKKFDSKNFSWKSNLKGSYSDSEDQSGSHTVYWNSSFSRGEDSFYIDSIVTNKRTGINNLFYSTQVGADRLNVGLSHTDLNSFGSISSNKMIGVNYIKNVVRKEGGNKRKPLEINLLHSAQINIKKDDELIHVSREESGQVSLDTSKFPIGSYFVTVLINYDNGTKDEQELFVSSNHADVHNSGFSGLSIGIENKSKEYFSGDNEFAPIAVTSFVYPLNEAVSGYLSGGYKNERFVINPAFIIDSSWVYIQSSILFDNKKDWFTNNYLRSEFNDHSFTGGINITHEEIVDYDRKNYYFRYQMKTENFGRFLFSYNKNKNIREAESYQASHDMYLYKNRHQSLRSRVSLSYTDEVFFGVEFTYSLGDTSGAFDYDGSLLSNNGDNQISHRINYDNMYSHGGLSSSLNSISGNNSANKFIQANINDKRYGYFSGQAGKQNYSGSSSKYLRASFDVNLAGNEEKAVVTGGRNVNTGIILDLSDMPNDELILTINDKKIRLKGNNKHVISLSPHHNYTVNLVNDSNPNQKIESRKHKIYLYEGNLVFLNWQSYNSKLYSGRAIKDGIPLSNQIISSEIGRGVTDENGYFTLEIKEKEETLATIDGKCKINHEDNLSFTDIECK